MHRLPVRLAAAVAISLCVAPLFAGNDQQQTKGEVRFRVTLPPDALQLIPGTIPSDQGDVKVATIRLKGEEAFSPAEPGVPDLPWISRFVALPPGAVVNEVEMKPGKTTVINGVGLVRWTQLLNPGQSKQFHRAPIEPVFFQIDKQPVYFPPGAAVPPHPELMKRPRWPEQPAVAEAPLEATDDVQVVRLRLSPIAWEPQKGTITFTSDIDVTVRFTSPKPKNPKKTAVLADVIVSDELRAMVVNPGLIPQRDWPRIQRPDAPYLIITDNFRWSENLEKGPALDGDLVAEFQRLADWKTRRGLKAKVVTISEIMEGRYGDYRTGAADLQEVLRRFLKTARRSWNTAWVLLGGTENLIPPRYVLTNAFANAAHYLFREGGEDPPSGRIHYHDATNTVRIHSPALVRETAAEILTTRDSTIFRRENNPTATRPGWTYVTDNTYATRTTTPTEWVILRGPRAAIEGTDLYVAMKENTIPTDLYYASLDDPLYGVPGVRDWDANGDGYYGQNSWTTSIDGVSWFPDVQLGRAPVENVAGARGFVDRLIVYESSGWRPASSHVGTRAKLTSTNWGAAGPAADRERYLYESLRAGEFHTRTVPGGVVNEINFMGRPVPLGAWDLIAMTRNTPIEWRVIPFKRHASTTDPGYHFYTDETFTTRSETTIEIFGIPFVLPVPTRFVKVFWQASDYLYSPKFFFDDFTADGSVVQQEEAQQLIQSAAPRITRYDRHYEDWFDLEPPNPSWALDPDWGPSMTFGFNIISAAGHGAPSGCCGWGTWASTTGDPSGLMYVDSCLTNAFDDPRGSLSEALLGHGNSGGPVAYIGSTRYSWIGLGADLQRIFWRAFQFGGSIGALHNTKAAHAVTSSSAIWAHYSINLMGDPSMHLWRGEPNVLTFEVPETVGTGGRLRVRLSGADGEPLVRARVAVTAPGIFQIAHTSFGGWAEFEPLGGSSDTVTVVAAPPGFLPVEATVTVVPGG